MAQQVAPWLQGLDEAWEIPASFTAQQQPQQQQHHISSASHDAHSIKISSTRTTRQLSSQRTTTTTSHNSIQRRRDPLAPLSHNSSNNSSVRRPNGTVKLNASRSFSGTSDDSVVQYGTIQQRSKSASPVKKQETLEWKRRLLKGHVGYGDQTDLFGPSGLENIFATPREPEPKPKTRSSMSWLNHSALNNMPSSPPPWPSQQDDIENGDVEDEYEDERLTAVDEETEVASEGHAYTEGETFESNPFDLDDSHLQQNQSSSEGLAQHPMSSPERLEPTEHNMVGNRTVSGQTECEDFSPVYISKHTTTNGQVNYKALDSHLVKKFQNMSFDLKQNSHEDVQEGATCRDEESVVQNDDSAFTDGPDSELPALPDLSLSENLPTGTPPSVAGLTGNVQTCRGGYSGQGSFKEKPLSPSPSRSQSSVIRDANSFLSPIAPTSRKHVQVQSPLREPSTPVNGEASSEARSRSSGSPLKLFGPHDTFTSNRLLRRMSQLDPDLSAIRSETASEHNAPVHPREASRNVSTHSFGSGNLSHHQFNAEITITSASDSSNADSDRSPGSDIPPPGARSPMMFKLETSPIARDTFKLKRRRSAVTSAGSTLNTMPKKSITLQATVEDVMDLSKAFQKPSETSLAMGKRPPNSPHKAPTPKRRRTLHASELQEDAADFSRSFHDNLQDAISTHKSNSERKVEELLEALRPRNPTPSQRRREQIEAEIREVAEQFATEAPEELEAVIEQVEHSMASVSPPSIQQQARTVAGQVAKFSLRVQKASGDQTERKRSVTTQDFFNEAVMVMRLIREKAGRQSGLGSVAESDQEGNSQNMDQSEQDLSALRVSRPPSREVPSGWRPRTSEQTDSRVMSHLRRFQENDDTEFIADSSASLEDSEQYEDDYVAIDEHSNIRIKGPLPQLAADDDDSSRPVSQRSNQSVSTDNSAATSTGRTLQTTCTRKSDNVGVLAPEHVAHLIGEQVGGMVYDKDRQQWVKTRSPQKPVYGSFLEPPSNITSDDDPFREISDLPVDEQKEEEIRKVSNQGRRLSALPDEVSEAPADVHDFAPQPAESRITSQETVLARPSTRESSKSGHTYSSSDPSKYTALHSSQQQTNETRATSWSDEELFRLAAEGKARQQPLAYAAAQAALAQRSKTSTLLRQPSVDSEEHASVVPEPLIVDHESATDDDCVGNSTLDEVNHHTDEPAGLQDDTALAPDNKGMEFIHAPKLRKSPTKVQFSSNHDTKARNMSLRRQTLTSRFNDADAMEQSELSFVAALPGERMMSVSLSVSRPLSKRQPIGHVAELPSSPSKYDPSYILSDLPDFTIHGDDVERPSERALAQRLAKRAAEEVDDRYALAVKDLVKTLVDVKSEEPYWEEVKQLDLHDQSVASLHGLNDFCGRVQEMDVSNNKLGYLNGAPSSLRTLVASSNMLSSLTPWTHLMNLQYLDISSNQLDSLKGLECLIHLRELRADDNQIDSLDGVLELDGLLRIRLRRNHVRSLDFENSYLQRLEELDLCANAIEQVHGLDRLSSLKSLHLRSNHLIGSMEVDQPMLHLKHLSLQECGLKNFDASNFPSLQTLLLDDNKIDFIDGLDTLKSLDRLSMRRQMPSKGAFVRVLEQVCHARTIQLSGCNLPSLGLKTGLLSLQYLELASCGLQDLPEDFGLKLPNLIALNLSFNSLRDIRPLLNVQKLEQLTICGNRLDRLRKSVATLSKMPTLTSLDMRDNPLTQGFYAPNTAMRLSLPRGVQTSIVRHEYPAGEPDEDEDVAAERVEASKHVLPARDANQDIIHHDRLDESTKLRRRVCHLMLGHSCTRLQQLDGMAFDKKAPMVKDRIWDRLVELGIMKKSGKVGLRSQESTP
ncbi:Putative leucine-rich repeat domain superfamily [Septoria linicola]|uniref:Leucine-rich repeat domain superfamily n=1 Tax=Septoria linicola TaxID=215465 RepID=A0A9Q9AXF0_9PEZI|nr:putative leucine-rich repeat domain superfamily [Septoria linicola]USW56900.1 Putative leucine-rich repeat domain superfamily [Septoria linicola]